MPRPNYQQLYDTMIVKSNWVMSVLSTSAKIKAGKPRYDAVSVITGVPWHVIGLIHNMECSLRFDRHLHNGDPLAAKTTHVPAGRPLTPGPWTWETSATDALKLRGLDKITDWSVANTLYLLEGFNGYGYWKRGINSPYLWSGTNNYTVGKYAADGVYDPNLVSQQLGVAPVLKAVIA